MSKKINIAVIAPNANIYSETFIKAHKDLLNGNIHFLYGGLIPTISERTGSLSGKNETFNKGLYWLFKKNYKLSSLRKYLVKYNIGVVLAEYGPVANSVLPVVEDLGIHMIAHFHGADASKSQMIIDNNNYSEVFRYSSYIIAVSKVMRIKLISLGCPVEKLILNTYGPRDEFFEVRPDMSHELFISLGRFTDKKAPYYTILAFKKVLEEFPTTRLIMGGDGDLLNTCKNIVRYLQIENNIDFPGILKPEDFRKYLKIARAFVQHSVTAADGDMEGTPLAILEASAAGVPVISTIHAGIPDVIINGVTGLLVNEHDVDGMAENMKKLLADKELAINLGNAGRENISKNYSMQKHIHILDELITKAFRK